MRRHRLVDDKALEWEIPTMFASTTDEKRRLTMPKELPPKSVVTIQQVAADSWLVTLQKPAANHVVVAFRLIQELPNDPEWEREELKIAKHNNRKLPRFEE